MTCDLTKPDRVSGNFSMFYSRRKLSGKVVRNGQVVRKNEDTIGKVSRMRQFLLSKIGGVSEFMPNISNVDGDPPRTFFYFNDGLMQEACPNGFGVAEEALQCGREWYLENRRHKALWSAWYGLVAWLRGFTVAEIRASIAR